MATTATGSSFMSIGSQSKPPSLSRDKYQQWKVQMVSFLEGIHPRITEFLHNPPFVPMKFIPRVPATATTAEVPKSVEPKPIALEGESLKDTYSRFNTLLSKCRRFRVHRTFEENNALFLKSLDEEWANLTMSMQSTLDLEVWSLSDIYGTLVSQEPQVIRSKKQIGGPLAVVGRAAETSSGENKGKKEEKKKEEKKKKKVLFVESDGDSSKDEVRFSHSCLKVNARAYQYDHIPEKPELLAFLRFHSYAKAITKMTQFKRKGLPPLWNTLFSVVNCCLIEKVGSHDQSTNAMLAN
ncbi:hypothetical protein OSB04_025214 [Centaurea solstitialis]|uniref:Uncharacterized protein n=1 Tax=Centaurea solstitialis TaxID=347529 RepID=A0AA38W3U4_9ASTR|nr:hypothetical protein OSB04_025214 [Centaurea solstitialis]